MPAQSITGTILGTVYDPSKSVIARAKVSLTSMAQGWTRSDETDSLGNYIFTNLPPGGYSIAVAAAGFQTVTVPDVQVLLDQRARVNAMLQPGAVKEHITVSAGAAPLLPRQRRPVGHEVGDR